MLASISTAVAPLSILVVNHSRCSGEDRHAGMNIRHPGRFGLEASSLGEGSRRGRRLGLEEFQQLQGAMRTTAIKIEMDDDTGAHGGWKQWNSRYCVLEVVQG